MTKIGLIDYGMGNLFSVQQAFKRVNQPLDIVSDITTLNICDALILPGVGAFDPAMTNLRNTDLVPSIIDFIFQALSKLLLGKSIDKNWINRLWNG